MADPTLSDQFVELGYELDFVDDTAHSVKFNSKLHSGLTIKISRTIISIIIYGVGELIPSAIIAYFTNIERVMEFIRDNYGIVPELPTKGVHDGLVA